MSESQNPESTENSLAPENQQWEDAEVEAVPDDLQLETNEDDAPKEEETPTPTCCSLPIKSSTKPCALCKNPTCQNCRSMVNAQRVCESCKAQLQQELENEVASTGHLMTGLAGGIVAALISGAVWAGIGISMNAEIGYVAVGVGWLTGAGVLLSAGQRKGANLQVAAAGCSLLGLLFGKYFSFAYLINLAIENGDFGPNIPQVSYFDPNMFQGFYEWVPSSLSPWDLLWAALAIGVAWNKPKPTEIVMN